MSFVQGPLGLAMAYGVGGRSTGGSGVGGRRSTGGSRVGGRSTGGSGGPRCKRCRATGIVLMKKPHPEMSSAFWSCRESKEHANAKL
jgi:hypothetical protein